MHITGFHPYTDNGEQADGMTTAVLPFTPYMKSDHLYTFPVPDKQDFEYAFMIVGERTKDHTLTLVRAPWKD